MADALYLSRLTLPLRSRDTQRLIADCHATHRFVMSGFPSVSSDNARANLNVLYRLEVTGSSDVSIVVQSAVEPRWAFESIAIRAEGPKPVEGFLARLAPGQRYRFRLHANPTRRVSAHATRGADLARGRLQPELAGNVGKRVAVRTEEARLVWLERKAAGAGTELVSATVSGGLDPDARTEREVRATRIDKTPFLRGRRAGQRLTFETARFEGLLEVNDPTLLRAAIRNGIGSGKAFGCGLLSLAPAAVP